MSSQSPLLLLILKLFLLKLILSKLKQILLMFTVQIKSSDAVADTEAV